MRSSNDSRPAPAPTCCVAWGITKGSHINWPSTRHATVIGVNYSANSTRSMPSAKRTCAAWQTRSSWKATEPVRGLTSSHRNDRLQGTRCLQYLQRRTTEVRNEAAVNDWSCGSSAARPPGNDLRRPERARDAAKYGEAGPDRATLEENSRPSAARVQAGAAKAN